MRLLSFILCSFLFGFVGIAQVTIYNEDFSNPTINNARIDNVTNTYSEPNGLWSLACEGDCSNFEATSYLGEDMDSLEAHNVNVPVSWLSTSINIENYNTISFTVEVASFGDFEGEPDAGTLSNDYVDVFFSLDDGVFQRVTNWNDWGDDNHTLKGWSDNENSPGRALDEDFVSEIILQNIPNGSNTLQLKVVFLNNDDGEYYRLDNIDVKGTFDCSKSTLEVSAGRDTGTCLGVEVPIGGSPTASGGSGNYQITWSPNGGEISNVNTQNPFITPTVINHTNYTVTVKDNATECSLSDEMTLAVFDTVVANAGIDKDACIGRPTFIGSSNTATEGSGVYAYEWFPQNSTLDDSSLAIPRATISTLGDFTYSVIVVDEITGCRDSSSIVLSGAGVAINVLRDDTISCVDIPLLLEAEVIESSSTNLAYEWSPNDIRLDDRNLQDVTFNSPIADNIVFTLEVVDLSNGCDATDSISIRIINELLVEVTADTTVCTGETLNFDALVTGGTNDYEFLWTPSRSLSDSSVQQPLYGPDSVSTTYTLVVQDNNLSCTGSATTTISVIEAPIADAGSDLRICQGQTVAIGGNPAGSAGSGTFEYNWSPPNGLSNPMGTNPFATPTIEFSSYTLTIRDRVSGCIATDAMIVESPLPPTADAGEDVVICVGESVRLGGTPSGTGMNPTFIWQPDVSLSNARAANPRSSPVDDITYTLTVIDTFNGCTISDHITIIANPIPDLSIRPKFFCSTDNPDRIEATIPDGKWSGIGIVNDDTGLFDPAVSGLGDFEVSYTVVHPINGCERTETITVSVYEMPTVVADEDIFFCQGTSGELSATGSMGQAPYTYKWEPVGSVEDPNRASTSAAPLTSTTYTVTLTDANGCMVQDRMRLRTDSRLVASTAGENVEICFNEYIPIGGSPSATGGTEPYQYKWEPSVGISNDTVTNPLRIDPLQPNYTLTVTDANNCTATATINLKLSVEMSDGATQSVCPGNAIIIGSDQKVTEGQPPFNYSWQPAALLNDPTLEEPTAAITQQTTFTLKLTDARGCIGRSNVTLDVLESPNANAGLDTFICPDNFDSVQLGGIPPATGGAGNFTFRWLPALTFNMQFESNPFVLPNETTAFTLEVTDAKGCKNSDVVVVNVSQGLIANAGVDAVLCDGNSTSIGGNPTVSGLETIASILWEPQALLSNPSFPNPQVLPNADTLFTLTVTDGVGCKYLDSVRVSTAESPRVNAGDNQNKCNNESGAVLGGSPTATGGLSPYKYSWQPKELVTNPAGENPIALVDETIIFTLEVVDANGCQSRDLVTITPTDFPRADAGVDQQMCANQPVVIGREQEFVGGTLPYRFQWRPANLVQNDSAQLSAANPTTTTDFTLTIIDANGCMGIDTVRVSVLPGITVNAGGIITACDIDSVQLGGLPAAIGGTGKLEYTWAPPKGLDNVKSANPIGRNELASFYTLTVRDQNNCTYSDAVEVQFGEKPTANIAIDVNGLKVDFTETSLKGTEWFWDFGNGNTTSFGRRVQHTFGSSDSTLVCVTVTGSGTCKDTSCIQLTPAIFNNTNSTTLLSSGNIPWKVFPNPVQEFLNISFNFIRTNAKEVVFTLYNMQGIQVLKSLNLSPATNKQQVNVAGLPPGQYLLQIISDGEQTGHQIVTIQ